jgi:steroid delta-isomerase-like uncharacterized protein
MSAEQNKALVRRFFEEIMNGNNLSLIDEFVAPDFVEHEAMPGAASGREGFRQTSIMFRSAFPDLKATINDMIAEGDKVAMSVTFTGTHKGEFMGMAPTGERFSMNAHDIMRIENGKLKEHWGVSDMMGMMQQLGAIPAPGEGGE